MVGSHEPKDWLSGSRGYGPQASCTLELRFMRSAHAQIHASTCRMSSSGSSSVGIVPSTSLKGTRSEGPEASVSWSSSSRIPSPTDAKSLRDLEVMKSCHDVVSVINEGFLGSIRECYSIPEEYALRALLPEQRPYNPGSSEISISIDALEVGLRLP
ncbi:hypothetical protein B296_00013343 [Ensete ventricosum]|uniref:Uncharacterized protein n=1 Tax=Ensete ventricosum TaxID=4639 RepID=A0A427A5M8_ENSVE|nr:hypothetical protein B296_00013343 [Ensete ventricosum]